MGAREEKGRYRDGGLIHEVTQGPRLVIILFLQQVAFQIALSTDIQPRKAERTWRRVHGKCLSQLVLLLTKYYRLGDFGGKIFFS